MPSGPPNSDGCGPSASIHISSAATSRRPVDLMFAAAPRATTAHPPATSRTIVSPGKISDSLSRPVRSVPHSSESGETDHRPAMSAL